MSKANITKMISLLPLIFFVSSCYGNGINNTKNTNITSLPNPNTITSPLQKEIVSGWECKNLEDATVERIYGLPRISFYENGEFTNDSYGGSGKYQFIKPNHIRLGFWSEGKEDGFARYDVSISGDTMTLKNAQIEATCTRITN